MARACVMAMVAAVLAASGCGVPAVEKAARRAPEGGATEYFGRPLPAVYAAARQVVADATRTPDWKELRVVHDDPAAGVLIAERRLEGVVPGLRVRDLWSFYVRPSGELTAVTFVFESSDAPTGTVGIRSWAKGRSDIFPAMSEALGSAAIATRPPDRAAEPTRAPRVDATPTTPAPGMAATEHRDATGGAATEAVERRAPERAVSLERVYALLSSSDEWRRATHKRRVGGQEIVTVGSWAQLEVRDGRVAVAFPSYPAPPAYDVARLMRFLADAGFDVDVLPGTAFRAESD